MRVPVFARLRVCEYLTVAEPRTRETRGGAVADPTHATASRFGPPVPPTRIDTPRAVLYFKVMTRQ